MDTKALGIIVVMLVLPSCGEENMATFYAQFEPSQVQGFVEDLSTAARNQNISSEIGMATDDRGLGLVVVEGSRGLLHFWAQNLPLSPKESEACGLGNDARPDPGQFKISVESRLPFVASSSAQAVSESLGADLRRMGHQTSPQPIKCKGRIDAEIDASAGRKGVGLTIPQGLEIADFGLG